MDMEHAVLMAHAVCRLLVDCRQGRNPRNGQRYNFRDQQTGSEFSFNSYTIPQDQLWKLALPAAALVGVAALAGPIIIGLTIGAVAMGAAVSMGAFALSTMFLPLIMMGVFGMMSFGAFATLGMFLVIPKLILTFVSVVGIHATSTAQHSTAQHSTAQHSTAQHSTAAAINAAAAPQPRCNSCTCASVAAVAMAVAATSWWANSTHTFLGAWHS
jgi:hypothetical protein